MADSVSRSAARTATVIAVPFALLAGIVVFWLMGGLGSGRPGAPGSPSASAKPQPSSSVSMAAPGLADTVEPVCRGFVAQLPDHIRNWKRRPVSAGPEQNAAYGEPPLRVACGGPAATVAPTATVYLLSGVCWIPAQPSGGATVWTTVDRKVPVAVSVPASYQQPGQWVTEFSATVAGAVPSLPPAEIPTGCH